MSGKGSILLSRDVGDHRETCMCLGGMDAEDVIASAMTVRENPATACIRWDRSQCAVGGRPSEETGPVRKKYHFWPGEHGLDA